MKQTIIVLGGDGFCGWPTSLALSKDYDVIIIDNLSRRDIDYELECSSLTPIQLTKDRIETWKKISGNEILYANIDIAKEYEELLTVVRDHEPTAIIHFAEQRSAPYSMKSSFTKQYTVNNNLNASNNTLCSIVDSLSDIHLIHLGSMGVYGYGTAGLTIPEGYLNVTAKGIDFEILYPANPGSIYHTTKCQDALLFQYYNKNDNIRITDLHQGIVWGTNTPDTLRHESLINRFDYDGDYGTVLNRFLMQAAINHPLTVYGTGQQTRAFINIQDTIKCIKLAIENEPDNKRVRIFNQATETHTLIDLAAMISVLTGVHILYCDNPRNEASENKLDIENKGLMELGLDPIMLNDGLMDEVITIADKYKERCDKTKILPTSRWK